MVAVFVLLLVAARLTENRMIWVALATGFLVSALLAAWRWRARLDRAPMRWVASCWCSWCCSPYCSSTPPAGGRGPISSRTPRSRRRSPTIRVLVLWQHTFERIRERPWTGFGFGKSILSEELRDELHDPMLAHAHNLFVSQWLQTGAIGVATLLAMLAALAWCYWTLLRASDGTLAALGLAGLAMLVTFVVKNLTDDFMIRPTSKEFWALNAMLIGYGLACADCARQASPSQFAPE